MRNDRITLLAVGIAIILLVALIVLSLQKAHEVDKLIQQVEEIKSQHTQVIKPADGRTPVLGKDYFVYNGQDGDDAYHIAVKHGYIGTIDQWLESLKVQGPKGDTPVLPPVIQDIKCDNGQLKTRQQNDILWLPTNIKCEVL